MNLLILISELESKSSTFAAQANLREGTAPAELIWADMAHTAGSPSHAYDQIRLALYSAAL